MFQPPPHTPVPLSRLYQEPGTRASWARPKPLFRTALAAQRRTLGDELTSTLDTMYNLGLLLWAQGHNAEALDICRQELKRVLGEDHPHTQRSRNYQAGMSEKHVP